MASSASQLRSTDMTPGTQVDYYSSAKDSWLPTTITKVDLNTGDIQIAVRGGTNIPKDLVRGKLRRHLTPTKGQLDWARSLVGSEEFQVFQQYYFHKYADPYNAPSDKFEYRDLPRCMLVAGREKVASLAFDLDQALGCVGSILELEAEADHLPSGDVPALSLTFTKFGNAFFTMLNKVLRDYGHNLHVSREVQRHDASVAQDYEFLKKLGEGSYGAVELVKEKSSGMLRAIKRQECRKHRIEIEMEMASLVRIDHPNIIKLRGYYEDKTHVYFIMDYCEGGCLQNRIKEHKAKNVMLAEDLVQHLLCSLLRAVAHLHGRGIVHCDIKGGNIMLANATDTVAPIAGRQHTKVAQMPHLMLIDLGCASNSKPGSCNRGLAGTPNYLPPEGWQEIITPASDIYSCGVVFYEMATLHVDATGLDARYPRDKKGCETYWSPGVWPWHMACMSRLSLAKAATDLVTRMLSYNRADRPSAQACLVSDFLKGLRLEVKPLAEQDQKVKDVVQQMMRYATRSLLYKSVAYSVARRWQSNQLPTVYKIFSMLDTSGSGLIDLHSAREGLLAFGFTSAAVDALVKAMDLNGDRIVDWTEFVAACICLGNPDLEPVLKHHFVKAAGSDDGVMDRQGLATLLPGYEVRDRAVGEIFLTLGKGRETISWMEFRAHFSQLSL